MNVGADGHTVKLPDLEEEVLSWNLEFNSLTDSEWKSLEMLFEETEGSLQTFLFLDPAANLLSRSEEFTSTVWQKDPYFTSTHGFDDPIGEKRATRLVNTGQIWRGMTQAIEAPGDFWYCLSLYARSSESTRLVLKRSSESTEDITSVVVSNKWRRYVSTGNLGVGSERMAFGIELPPGATVYVFGLQVEAQPSPSSYKRTREKGGIYPDARFAQDTFTVVTEAPNQHSVSVRVSSGTRN
jgi:hypothetical protein